MEDQSIGRSLRGMREGEGLAALLARLLASGDQEVIWQLSCAHLRGLGFAHLLYGYSPDSRGPVLGSPEDYLVMSTLAPPVIEELVLRNHFRQSMTFLWALGNTGIAKWSRSAVDCGLPADFTPTPESLEFFARHDMMTGCCIGLSQERTRGRAVLALIGPPTWTQAQVDDLIDTCENEIFVVASVMHRCLSNLPLRIERRSLTPRQREVLEWVANGKTAADIALIMGISPPTVEKHLRLARETLGVETTAHALIKAAFLNQVFVTFPATPLNPAPQT